MAVARKIFIDADEALDSAVKKIAKVPGKEVVLNFPKGALIGSSLDHLQALKQEGKRLGKKLLVESIDDHILEIAALVGFQAVNPVFRTRARAVVDVLPRSKRSEARRPTAQEDASDGDEEGVDDDAEVPEKAPAKQSLRFPKTRTRKKQPGAKRVIGVLLAVGALGASGFFVATRVLPRATVELTLKRYPVPVARAVRADVNASEVSNNGLLIIPGEFLKAVKNVEMSFPASGWSEGGARASGRVTIFNEFSEEPQTLVVLTRFEAPDGKIFRLKEKALVPGAVKNGGKLAPGSVEAEVVADKSGEAYNVGAIARWTIPGFKGTPRYDGFYAKSTEPMRGGSSEGKPQPTDADLDAARGKVQAALLDTLQSELLVVMKDTFEVLPSSTVFRFQNENTTPAEDKVFKYYGEGELRQFVFDRKMFREALIASAETAVTADMPLSAAGMELHYAHVAPDAAAGTMTFNVSGTVVLAAKVNTSTLAKTLQGRSAKEMKETIFKLPGLDRARVTLWPFWVTRAPEASKIRITSN